MNTKTTFTIIIAVVVIAAMIIFRDQLSLPELVSYIVGASGALAGLYNWISKIEIKEAAEADILEMQNDIDFYKMRVRQLEQKVREKK